jgi:putative heme iron utilization protein
MKITTLFSLLMLFASCKSTIEFSDTFGEIESNSVLKIEYYSGKNFRPIDSLTKANGEITEIADIQNCILEINKAPKSGPWKGANWDQIHIVMKDTTLILKTNGKVIGGNYNSGTFYQLQDKNFISKYFQKANK